MAAAQPPAVYAGFSSTDVTQGAEYRPYRTRSTSSIRYGGTAATGLTGKGSYVTEPPLVSGVKVHKYSRSTYAPTNPTKVRKVHRLVSDNGKDTGDIITPSSWRVGKELAERILKAQQRAEELLSDSPLDHSSGASRLSFRDSLDPSSHASTPRHTHYSFSDTRLHAGEPEKPVVPLSPEHRGAAEDSDEGSEVASSYESVVEVPPRTTHISSDVERLLEELRGSSREGEGEAAVGVTGLAMGRRKDVPAATGRASAAKTKYSYGKLLEGRGREGPLPGKNINRKTIIMGQYVYEDTVSAATERASAGKTMLEG